MLRRSLAASFALASFFVLFLLAAMIGSTPNRAQGEPPDSANGNRTIIGDATMVNGNLIVTWAKVTVDNEIKKVGVTIPVDLFDNQPEEDGDGPGGAIASLVFPSVVRDTTYLNHFELHTEPHGHVSPPGSVNPNRFAVPHFDFHFYAIEEDEVRLIPAVVPPPPLPAVPAQLLPPGYIQPGPSIAEMGRHSSPLISVLDPDPLSTVMIAGFLPSGAEMHFVEPMVSREFLVERTSFELPMPLPAALGRTTLYPTKFDAEYDAEQDAYHFFFHHFVAVE